MVNVKVAFLIVVACVVPFPLVVTTATNLCESPHSVPYDVTIDEGRRISQDLVYSELMRYQFGIIR